MLTYGLIEFVGDPKTTGRKPVVNQNKEVPMSEQKPQGLYILYFGTINIAPPSDIRTAALSEWKKRCKDGSLVRTGRFWENWMDAEVQRFG